MAYTLTCQNPGCAEQGIAKPSISEGDVIPDGIQAVCGACLGPCAVDESNEAWRDADAAR